jgi:hypothetical protein
VESFSGPVGPCRGGGLLKSFTAMELAENAEMLMAPTGIVPTRGTDGGGADYVIE